MALFRALQGIAPQLDTAMVLNVGEGAGLVVANRDDQGQILHASDAAVAQLISDDGTDPGALSGRRYFDEHGGELERDQLPYELVRQTGDVQLNAVFRIDGARGAVWLQMSVIAFARRDAGYSVLGIGSDVTEQRDAVAAAAEAPFAVIMVDLDHFKAVNDVHSHAARPLRPLGRRGVPDRAAGPQP